MVQAADLQGFGGLHEIGELLFQDRDLAFVHEVDYALELVAADVLEDDDGVLAGRLREDLLEEGAAGREHDLVGAQAAGVLAHESHVHEGFALEEGVERVQHVALVVVPAQAVQRRRHGWVFMYGVWNKTQKTLQRCINLRMRIGTESKINSSFLWEISSRRCVHMRPLKLSPFF